MTFNKNLLNKGLFDNLDQFLPIYCSKVAKEGKSCSRLLALQKVAQNAKSCSKVADFSQTLFDLVVTGISARNEISIQSLSKIQFRKDVSGYLIYSRRPCRSTVVVAVHSNNSNSSSSSSSSSSSQ